MTTLVNLLMSQLWVPKVELSAFQLVDKQSYQVDDKYLGLPSGVVGLQDHSQRA